MTVSTEFLRLHLTVLCETLKEGSNNHDQRTQHDGPSSSVAMSEPRREWNTKDRAKLIRRVNEAEQAWLNGKIAIFVRAPIAKVYSQVSTNSKHPRVRFPRLDPIGRALAQIMGPLPWINLGYSDSFPLSKNQALSTPFSTLATMKRAVFNRYLHL